MIETGHVAVEICLDSLASAFAADRGGADRIELCDQLPVGGVTPTSALVRQVRSAVRCKLHVLIRPRAGDFVYSADDIALMESEIDDAKAQGADGVVLGVLDRSKNIDIDATGESGGAGAADERHVSSCVRPRGESAEGAGSGDRDGRGSRADFRRIETGWHGVCASD